MQQNRQENHNLQTMIKEQVAIPQLPYCRLPLYCFGSSFFLVTQSATAVSQCLGYPRLCVFEIGNIKWESILRVRGRSRSLHWGPNCRWRLSVGGCGSWESEDCCMRPGVRCREESISGTCWMNSAHEFQWQKDQDIEKGLKSVSDSYLSLEHLTSLLEPWHIVSFRYASAIFSCWIKRKVLEGFQTSRRTDTLMMSLQVVDVNIVFLSWHFAVLPTCANYF